MAIPTIFLHLTLKATSTEGLEEEDTPHHHVLGPQQGGIGHGTTYMPNRQNRMGFLIAFIKSPNYSLIEKLFHPNSEVSRSPWLSRAPGGETPPEKKWC